MSLSFSIPSESFPVFEGTLRDSKLRKKKKKSLIQALVTQRQIALVLVP